jgi:hypothetical protein
MISLFGCLSPLNAASLDSSEHPAGRFGCGLASRIRVNPLIGFGRPAIVDGLPPGEREAGQELLNQFGPPSWCQLQSLEAHVSFCSSPETCLLVGGGWVTGTSPRVSAFNGRRTRRKGLAVDNSGFALFHNRIDLDPAVASVSDEHLAFFVKAHLRWIVDKPLIPSHCQLPSKK